VRCREDIRVDLMRARHRIGGFLLRREIYWEGPGEARRHRRPSLMLSAAEFGHGGAAVVGDGRG
jgi:hypothetical protein